MVVETPLLPIGAARAAAVGAAGGAVVAFVDAHSRPARDWAERLLAAHDGACDAVAPGFRNANPDGALSWAAFLMDYGRWLAEAPANGKTPAPPTAICSWRREALLAADRLAELLAPGAPLEANGAAFAQEPAADVALLNVARGGPFASERYLRGRIYAARRSRSWSIPGRALCALGFAALPVLRLIRTQPAVRAARAGNRLPRTTVPAVVVGSVLWGLGEAVGYVAGVGRAEARILEYELHKERFAWRKL